MIGVIAQLTLRRLFRGRAVWISVLIAALPVVFAGVMRSQGRFELVSIFDIVAFTTLLLAVLPGMFVAASIGEDIEDRTTTYVWSRPVPRWAMPAGKLLALGPLTAALVGTSWITAVSIGTHALPSTLSIIAFLTGTLVACMAAAAIGTLVPKHGMSLSIAYMLFFDIPVGAMPFSLAELSITHQLRAFSGVLPGVEPTGGAIGLAVLGSCWLAVTVWRNARREA